MLGTQHLVRPRGLFLLSSDLFPEKAMSYAHAHLLGNFLELTTALYASLHPVMPVENSDRKDKKNDDL